MDDEFEIKYLMGRAKMKHSCRAGCGKQIVKGEAYVDVSGGHVHIECFESYVKKEKDYWNGRIELFKKWCANPTKYKISGDD
jgi:hypothetical protein